VVKVIKKVAPIILPIALSFTPLGPIFGSALGSGIGTLIQGGSIKDALKSALIAGATGAVFSGLTGTSGGFFENIKTSLSDPIGRFSQTISGAQTSLSNVFGGEAARAANAGQQTFFSNYIAPTAAPTAAPTSVELSNAGAPTDATTASVELSNAGAPTAAVSNATPTPTSSNAVMSQLKESYNANLMIARPNNAGVPVDVQLVNGATTTIQAGGNIPAGATVTGFGSPVVAPTLAEPPGFVESIKAAFNPNDNISFLQGMENAFLPSSTLSGGTIPAGEVITNPSANQYLQASGVTPLAANAAQRTAAQKAVEAVAPGLIRTYGPLAAVGTGVAAASGFFSSPEQEQLNIAARDENGNIITGEDLINADPSKYLVGELGSLVLDPNTGTYVPRSVNPVAPISDLTIQAPTYSTYQVPTQYGLSGTSPYLRGSTPGGPFARPYVTQAAQGGAIFPRRNGGIMPEEGIPGQDSVRAMLMPGEFVMTTDAVRGAGNGNLNNGIKNMYSVMRNLEARGRA
jgi:hypothetical protein